MVDKHVEVIAASLTGELSDEERRQLAALRRDPEFEREYQRLTRLWTVTASMDLPPADMRVPAAEAIVRRAAEKSTIRLPSAVVKTTPAPRNVRFARYGIGAAAILVVGLGLGALLAGLGGGDSPAESTAVVTGVGQVATVNLQGGTVVKIAPESRLEFPRHGARGEIVLAGRAYFAVPPGQDEPFQVVLPTGSVLVRGTRFDVEGRGQGIQVAVVEGEVRVVAPGGEVSVRANQVARADEQGSPRVEQVDNVFEVVDWLGRFFAFQSTPLEEVAAELERRFALPIEIADDVLRLRTVTGWFADQTPDQMIAAICRAVDAHCTLENGTVLRMELPSAVSTR